jgi:hypothetical protein
VGPEETGASLALSSDLATLSKEIASRVIELKQRRTPASTDSNAASAWRPYAELIKTCSL